MPIRSDFVCHPFTFRYNPMLIRSPVDTFFIGRHVATFVCNVLLCSHLTVFVAAMADSLATIDSPPSSSKMQDHEKISLDTDSGTCAVGWLLFEPAAKCFVFDPRPASFNDNVLWCSQLNATTVSIHRFLVIFSLSPSNQFIRIFASSSYT